MDPLRLHPQQLVVPPQALPVIAQFQGERTVAEVAEQFKIPADQLENLVMALETHYLLWGPSYLAQEAIKAEEIDGTGLLPKGAAFMLGADAGAVGRQLDAWLAEVEDPELPAPPQALVVPHLDYHRGWPLYATGYRAWQGADPPDRVVVLGTNHHGIGDGVVGTRWRWTSPLGSSVADTPLQELMDERLGDGLLADQLDHVPEHSIALQLPWIQRVFGEVPVSGFLVPNPLQPMISDDGKRVSIDQFVTGLRDVLQELGGTTRLVASSDLSHVGPQFGEPDPLDDARREEVEQHDREALSIYLSGDDGRFVEFMRNLGNPSNWCSIGNMSALLGLVHDEPEIELLEYRQAFDESNHWMVSASSCAIL